MTARRGRSVFHYLSGAGMSGIRIRAGANAADAKRNRFLAAASVAVAVWLVLMIWL